MRQIILKPQDLVIALKFAINRDRPFTFAGLGAELSLSASEAHAGVRRCQRAGLLSQIGQERTVAIVPALQEFVCHGAKYAFPAVLGPVTRGIPTAAAGPSLSRLIMASNEGAVVWPTTDGNIRGPALCPLYPKAVSAAQLDPIMYDVLTMIDAIRVGAARDRELATSELLKVIS